MSNGLVKESRLVNPMAKTILTLEVNDQMQSKLNSSLPPRDTAKVLVNVALDLIFGYAEALVDSNQKVG